jgi:hypothetical protein
MYRRLSIPVGHTADPDVPALGAVRGNSFVGVIENLKDAVHPNQLKQCASRLPESEKLDVAADSMRLPQARNERAQTAAVNKLNLGKVQNDPGILRQQWFYGIAKSTCGTGIQHSGFDLTD